MSYLRLHFEVPLHSGILWLHTYAQLKQQQQQWKRDGGTLSLMCIQEVLLLHTPYKADAAVVEAAAMEA
jgi:hypothetical protein